MKKNNDKIEKEMEAIVCKTVGHIQKALDEQGEEKAKALTMMIANGIREQLGDKDMSTEDVDGIYELFIAEINAAVFDKKH